MPRGKGIYDDEDADQRKDERSGDLGPVDEDRDDTGDDAPDVADTGGEPTA